MLTWKMMMQQKRKTVVLAVVGAMSVYAQTAFAADETKNSVQVMPEVVVSGTRINDVTTGTKQDNKQLSAKKARTSDSMQLLADIPGISSKAAGGVSSLPVLHGLADDRLLVKTDGMSLISSCPNHMNSPLSYMDASKVDSVQVLTGTAPVSA
ncbi:TonB-dependent receptor plug domain-containing protein [Paludibacterium denitrificans]|uniref:TonB-dependent receptor plug domain-containing protein n=1 Tax=Paludibacterium denitrificans TaxID=2675226 RepID=UPI001E531A82|nr:TonB-dependent receptor plug domain-containing protein [Paludibacterium denitrificans]